MRSPVGSPLGVGIIGAGVATQAIHLPTLARLRDRLRVTHVVGRDAATATAVAARVGARGGTSVEALLDDPAVDLVAVCSPHDLHAGHAIAACAAGKRGVLVEKPLALTREDAIKVGDAATRFRVPVVVGAMHRWDPAWQAASSQWLEVGGDTRLIRSTIHVPVNGVIFQSVADLARPATGLGARVPPHLASRMVDLRNWLRPPDLAATETRLRDGILLLAVHAIPLVRALAPGFGDVAFARPTFPWGYALAYGAGQTVVTMTGSIGGRWTPTWTFDAWAEDRHLHVDFPPAFVMAGSGHASISGPDGRVSWRTPQNGYAAEWLHLADVAEGRAELGTSVAAAIDDTIHATTLADAGAERLRRAPEAEP